MSVIEGIFLFLCVYVLVELVALPLAAIRGKDVRGRVITWLVALLVAVVLGLVNFSTSSHIVMLLDFN